MTGHKDGSHKKRSIMRLETTATKRAAKKVRDSEPTDDVSTVLLVVLVVTQSSPKKILLFFWTK
jgi:hypothetical protein